MFEEHNSGSDSWYNSHYKWLSNFIYKTDFWHFDWIGNIVPGICANILLLPSFSDFYLAHTHRYVRLFHLKSFRQTTKGDCIQCSAVSQYFQYYNFIGRFVCFTFVTNTLRFYWTRITEFFHRLRRKSSPNIIISPIYQYTI